jgi:hypothetical protein
MISLTLMPCHLAEANAFVAAHHRHHGRVVGAKFALAAAVEGRIVGVAIVGRPVARGLQDGFTVEITRVATDGTPNACSFLYSAARRAAMALGYRRVVTYTLASEPGTSLRAAGWRATARVRARPWSCRARPRTIKAPPAEKVRWEPSLGGSRAVDAVVRERPEERAELPDGGADAPQRHHGRRPVPVDRCATRQALKPEVLRQ